MLARVARREIEEAAARSASDRWDDEPELVEREALDLAPSTPPAFIDPTSSHLAKQAFMESVSALNAARPGTVILDDAQTTSSLSSYRSQSSQTQRRIPAMTIRVRAGLSTGGALAVLVTTLLSWMVLARVAFPGPLRGGEALAALVAHFASMLAPLFASSRAHLRVEGDVIRSRAWWRTRSLSGLRRAFLVPTPHGPTRLHVQSDSEERALFVLRPRRHADAIVRVIQNHVRWSAAAARDAEAEADRARV